MNDDIRHRLEAAGDRPVPEPRPGFDAELEERLLSLARTASPGREEAATQPPPGLPTRAPTPRLRPTFRLAASLAGVAGLVAIVVLVGSLGARPTLALELTESVNVEVVLADGTTLVDPDGLLLPDGAVVRVGAGGSARVGELVLGAGDVATVSDRRIRVDRRDDSTTSVVATPTPVPSLTAPAATSTPDVAPTDAPATPRRDGSAAPTPPATPGSYSPPPATTPPVNPTEPPDPRPTPTAATDVRPIWLEARVVGPGEIGASWTGAPGTSRYILLGRSSRDGVAPDPAYPGSPVIGEFTHPPIKPLIFRVGKDVTEVRLLVVALGADGTLVGRSDVAVVRLRD